MRNLWQLGNEGFAVVFECVERVCTDIPVGMLENIYQGAAYHIPVRTFWSE